jgi:ribosomal protein S18 acetylase RimI-like enzyme
MYTTQGHFGIEFISPSQMWRIKKPEGVRVFADLLHELSPYHKRSIRTRALRRLAQRSCLLVASDLDAGHHGHTVGLVRLEIRCSNGIRYGEIHDLIVAETHQHLGIGKALMGQVIKMATTSNLPYVELAVKQKRRVAVSMFGRLGFRQVSLAGDAIRYRRDLKQEDKGLKKTCH